MFQHRRVSFFGIVVLAGIFILATVLTAPAQKLPRSLTYGTNPPGSLFHSAGSGIAKVLSNKLGIPVRVQPNAGSNAVMDLLNAGEIQLGVNNTNDLRMAYRGLKPYRAAPNLRIITTIMPLRVAMFVPTKSDVKTLKDLKGKRITGEFTAQLAVWYNVSSILAGAEMSWDDVKVVPVPNVVVGTQALMENRVDAALFALGAGKVKEANASISGGVRFIPIDNSPEGIKRMQKVMPGTYPLLVKKGSTVGVLEDIWVEGYDIFVSTGKHVSDDVAYAVVKAMYEAEQDVKKAFRPLRAFSKKKMVKENITVPFHPGAIKAYKELGLWGSNMDAIQKRLLGEAGK